MRILVAGGTGTIGREVVRLLDGHEVHVLARRAHPTVPTLIADVTTQIPRLGDFDVVVSAVGASTGTGVGGRSSFDSVDRRGNLALLEACERDGVSRFVYVSAHPAAGYADTAYIEAHRAVEVALEASPIPSTAVRPVGLFTALEPLLTMARIGIGAVVGDGSSRTNPIHPADLAQALVDVLEQGPATVDVGGPEVFTRLELLELAFDVLGRPPRVVHVPPGLPALVAPMVRAAHPRLGEMVEFVTRVSVADAIAPTVGERTLRAWWEAQPLR